MKSLIDFATKVHGGSLTGEWFFELFCRYGFESMAFNALVLAFIALIFGALIGYIFSEVSIKGE